MTTCYLNSKNNYLQLLLFVQPQQPLQILILSAEVSRQYMQSLSSLKKVHKQLYLQQTTGIDICNMV